jgi:RHS repeat-associated protein
MVYLDLLRRYAQLHELSLVDDLNPTGHAQVMDEIVGGVVQREYTYGLQRISQYQVIGNLWTPSFYVYDGAGSVRQLANAAGAVTDTYEYDAFGVTLSHTGTMPNNYMYRGEQYDADLGLYYLRARYYNSLTGRFLSRDPEAGKPVDPKTLHKYLYAGGDPVDSFDPTGRTLFDYEETLARSTAETIAYSRRIASLARCVIGVEILALKLIFNQLSSDIYSTIGLGTLFSGCISSVFPAWPF